MHYRKPISDSVVVCCRCNLGEEFPAHNECSCHGLGLLTRFVSPGFRFFAFDWFVSFSLCMFTQSHSFVFLKYFTFSWATGSALRVYNLLVDLVHSCLANHSCLNRTPFSYRLYPMTVPLVARVPLANVALVFAPPLSLQDAWRVVNALGDIDIECSPKV